MSDRPTPETESHFPSSRHKDDSWVVSCEIGLIRNLERERDEARELARQLMTALKDQHNFSRHFSSSGHNSRFAKMQRDTESLLAKAKEVLP